MESGSDSNGRALPLAGSPPTADVFQTVDVALREEREPASEGRRSGLAAPPLASGCVVSTRVADPLTERDEVTEALEIAAGEARRYLADLESHPVLDRGAEQAIRRWSDPMPDEGDGTLTAV